MKRKLLVVLAILAMLCWVGVASATPITGKDIASSFESLIDVNKSGLVGSGTFATVDVFVYTDHTASMEFTGAQSTYLLGSELGFNLSQPNITVSNITYSGAVKDPAQPEGFPTFNPTPADIQPKYGTFSNNMQFHDAFGFGFHDISFVLSGTWGDASTVLKDNGSGYDAYAHVQITSGNTGAVAEAAVPIPPTALLLGTGLLGLVGLGWRRRQDK